MGAELVPPPADSLRQARSRRPADRQLHILGAPARVHAPGSPCVELHTEKIHQSANSSAEVWCAPPISIGKGHALSGPRRLPSAQGAVDTFEAWDQVQVKMKGV